MDAKRHRILYIEKPIDIGGSVTSLYGLVGGLNTSRYEPVVLFHEPNPYRDHFQSMGVRVIVLNEKKWAVPTTVPQRDIAASLNRYSDWLANVYRATKKTYVISRQDWPIARRVARLIKDEAIDLVHQNNNLSGNRDTIMAAQLAGVPQICHVRTLHTFSYFEKYLSRYVDSFIYVSKATEQVYQGLGIIPDIGHVIYNAFNWETFVHNNHPHGLRAEFGLSDQERLISNVGRLVWWKGQDYFLRALADVIKSQANTKALIVGAPNSTLSGQMYYKRLQKLVVDLKLWDHVIFTGFRADIPRIMAASDIVVHSASEPEPFGRVVVEAMIAGRPVIATGAGGVLEIVEDQVTGLLVPPKNDASMAKAILQLLQNPRQAHTLGQRAQQKAKERFSVKQHVTAVQRIYQKVLTS